MAFSHVAISATFCNHENQWSRTTDWALVRQSHPEGKLFGYCHPHWHEPMRVHARVSALRFREGHSHCEVRLALNGHHCSCHGLLSAGIIDLSHHTPCCVFFFFFIKMCYPVLPYSNTV